MNEQDNRQESVAPPRDGAPPLGWWKRLLGSQRQWLYPRPFRIAPPVWPAHLLEALDQSSAQSDFDRPPEPPDGMDDPDVRRLIAEVATGLWRARRRSLDAEDAADEKAARSAQRHLESAWDTLAGHGVEVREHTGERYVPGLALSVLAFQPTPGVGRDMIAETLRPSVYLNDKLVQRGQVIVATPFQEDAQGDDPESGEETETQSDEAETQQQFGGTPESESGEGQMRRQQAEDAKTPSRQAADADATDEAPRPATDDNECQTETNCNKGDPDGQANG